ncbi:DUF3298 domain-containing protein [bacterium]|nr:DUF3298 domain-containing protein [bacterium]
MMKNFLAAGLLALHLCHSGWCQEIHEKFKDKGKKAGCEVTVSLPKQASPVLKSLTQSHIKSFKQEYHSSDYDGEFGWYYSLNWTRQFSNSDVAAYLGLEESYQGGAHPSHAQIGVMISPKTQKQIKLADCFKKGSPWLTSLADYCKQKLKEDKDLTPEDINQGAAPKAENYADVLPGAKGLTVYFQEYQVGPYAAGPQEVLVPYKVLAPYLDPQGPLGALGR